MEKNQILENLIRIDDRMRAIKEETDKLNTAKSKLLTALGEVDGEQFGDYIITTKYSARFDEATAQAVIDSGKIKLPEGADIYTKRIASDKLKQLISPKQYELCQKKSDNLTLTVKAVGK